MRQNDTLGTRGTPGTLEPALTNLTNCDDDGSVVVMTLNLYEAKTQLSALVDQAAAGAEIIIAKNGKPMAKLVAFKQATCAEAGSPQGQDLDLGRFRCAAAAGHR